MKTYIKESRFLSNPNKRATTAAQIQNKVLILVVLDLRVEPRHALVHNMDLVFGVPTDGPAVLLQRKAWGQRRLALLDDQFINLLLFLVLGLSPLALFGRLLVLNFLKNLAVFLELVFEGLGFLLGHALLFFLEHSVLWEGFRLKVALAAEGLAWVQWLPLPQVLVVVLYTLRYPFDISYKSTCHDFLQQDLRLDSQFVPEVILGQLAQNTPINWRLTCVMPIVTEFFDEVGQTDEVQPCLDVVHCPSCRVLGQHLV